MTKQAKKANGAALSNISSLMKGLAIPGFDLEVAADIQRRNWEALLEANRAASEGYQSLFNRQIEIAQTAMQDASGVFQKAIEGGANGSVPADQLEVTRVGLEQAIGNIRELAEIVQEANSAPVRIVQDRISEGMDELHKLAKR